MDIQLISGVFSIAEAEQLIKDLFAIKIELHQKRIRTLYQHEEDIEQAERKIVHLEGQLREAIARLKQSGKEKTALNAHIEINTIERLTP